MYKCTFKGCKYCIECLLCLNIYLMQSSLDLSWLSAIVHIECIEVDLNILDGALELKRA